VRSLGDDGGCWRNFLSLLATPLLPFTQDKDTGKGGKGGKADDDKADDDKADKDKVGCCW